MKFDTDVSPEILWLAGLLEGEGCFLPGPPSEPNACRIVLVTTDKDVAETAQQLMGARSLTRRPRREPHHKQAYEVQRSGNPARELMRSLYPLMSARRKKAIEAAVVRPRPRVTNTTLTFEQAEYVRKLRAGGATPKEIVAAVKQRYGLSISRDVVRATKTGYRAEQLVPELAPQTLDGLV